MYVLDSNVLIEAKNRYYSFDIAPGFWDWLDHAHAQSLVCSIEPVREELLVGNDDLAAWVKAHHSFFRPIDTGTTQHFSTLTTWVNSRDFLPTALHSFTSNHADYMLVAFAREHHSTVVTHERSQPTSRKRVLIPDACRALNVPVADTFHMLRQTGTHFDLRVTHPEP